jgi:hypothetical protein
MQAAEEALACKHHSATRKYYYDALRSIAIVRDLPVEFTT